MGIIDPVYAATRHVLVPTLVQALALLPAAPLRVFTSPTLLLSEAAACVLLASLLLWRLILSNRCLRESRSLFQAVFDNMSEGAILLDCDRNDARPNLAASTLLGIAPDNRSVPGIRELFDVFETTGEQLPADALPSARAMQGHFESCRELTFRRKDTGKTTIVEVGTFAVGACPDTRVRQIMITYRDITESRQSDAVLRRLAAIVDSSEDAVIGKDLNGIITTWNHSAERIFGYTAQEIIGKPIRHLIPPDHLQEETDIMTRIQRGETIVNLDTERQRKDGQLINVSLTISPILDSVGRIIGASKIARDITEKKLLQRQLHHSQKMEAIGQLTGGIAHDFNNLLAIITGNLELMQLLLPESDAAQRRIEIAQKAAARGADLTRRLLSFASKEQLHPTSTALEGHIQNMVDMAARVLGPEITIETRFGASIPAVYIDPSGLESALLNLAVNARDAMPHGGVLTLSTHLSQLDQTYPLVQTGELEPGPYACISISDTGEGMSKETLERVFEPFYTTKPRGKGTGLGLAMVYGFVRQSGGSVRIYSELGCGTTVLLHLPLSTTPAEPATIPFTLPTAIVEGTVLVVDDEPDLLEVALAYLAELGFPAYSASNAAQALDLLRFHHGIDLLITDIIMPGMNGIELAHTARESVPGLSVIYSSGFTADALAERSVAALDFPLLRKPFRRNEFKSLVCESLHHRNQSAQQILTPDPSQLSPSPFLPVAIKPAPTPLPPFPERNLSITPMDGGI